MKKPHLLVAFFDPEQIFRSSTNNDALIMPIHTAAAQELAAQFRPKMRQGMPSLPYLMKVAASDEQANIFLFEKGIFRHPDWCAISGCPPMKMKGKNSLQVRCSKKAEHYKCGFGKNKV